MVSVFNKGDKMFENQIATLTTILKDKDIHNYMGDTFWNIIKAVSLGDIGALFDSSIDIKNMLFHAPSVLFWDKMQRYMKNDGFILHTNVDNIDGVRAAVRIKAE